MNFPGGNVALSMPLLSSGLSGSAQVTAPEQFEPLTRMSDSALERLSDDLLKLLESETRAGGDERLAEYIDLLSLQCMREVMRRSF